MALTLLHADTFNRADSTLSGATFSDGLGAWTVVSGAWEVVSNQGRSTTPTGDRIAYDSAMSVVTDQRSEFTVISDDIGAVCRWDAGGGGIGTFYLAYVGIGGGLALYYYNGSFNAIGSGSGSVTAGDVVALDAVGTAITVRKNGTSTITATDSTYASGKCGMYGGGTGNRLFDDYNVYTEPAAGGHPTSRRFGLIDPNHGRARMTEIGREGTYFARKARRKSFSIPSRKAA